MSPELPSASSLRSGPSRGAGHSRATRRGQIGFVLLLALVGLALLIAAISIVSRAEARPRLLGLEPSLGDAGGVVLLKGRNFGAARGEAHVDLDGMAPTSSSYLAWTDGEIRLRLPASFDSGLVRVVTKAGRSKPRLFMNRARLPVLASSAGDAGTGPRIASIAPEEGTIGSLVTIVGSGFGESRGASSVRFPWAASADEAALPGDQTQPLWVSPSEPESAYELWSDKELRVRVPDGAASGSLYVVLDKSRSNAAFLRVFSEAGTKSYSSRVRYSISQSISITRIKASGQAELYLWAPLPALSASQRLVGILGQEPPPAVGDYRGIALFRFPALSSGKDRAIKQSFLVEVFSVEASIDPARDGARPAQPSALAAAFTAPDALVPSDAPAVRELARKILRGESGSWRSARLVWDWLQQNLAWTEGRAREHSLDALADRRADSYSYALISAALLRAAGLPTLPVAGYLVDSSGRAARHYWVEVYLYGLGWVPLDPALGRGATPGGIHPPWQDRSRYFGGLDNRHIAFSRGLTILAPLDPAGRRISKERRWSFQSYYEEASGALDSYSSYWGDIIVTGMY